MVRFGGLGYVLGVGFPHLDSDLGRVVGFKVGVGFRVRVRVRVSVRG